MIRGVDVSEYQPKVDWAQLIIDGLGGFAYAKATDGTNQDRMHSLHIQNADEHDIPIGSYCFGHPSMNVVLCADTFLRTVEAEHTSGDRLSHVIDMEALSSYVLKDGKKVQIVPSNAGEWANAWCERVKARSGDPRIKIYSSVFYWLDMCKQIPELGGTRGWDWWMALYTGVPNWPTKFQDILLPAYVAHQYAGDVKLSNQEGYWDLDVVYDDDVSNLLMVNQ